MSFQKDVRTRYAFGIVFDEKAIESDLDKIKTLFTNISSYVRNKDKIEYDYELATNSFTIRIAIYIGIDKNTSDKIKQYLFNPPLLALTKIMWFDDGKKYSPEDIYKRLQQMMKEDFGARGHYLIDKDSLLSGELGDKFTEF